ncbi:MAG: hypothetical protein RLY93_05805 [Sumerlaeia bacterium]
MSNYVLDQAFRVEESEGVAAHRAVVHGPGPGQCQYPAAANARPIVGVTTHAQSRAGKAVAVRRLGIVPVEAASAIALGQSVVAADATGRVKAAAHAAATLDTGTANGGVTLTAREPGPGGNGLAVVFANSGNDQVLAASFDGATLIVTLATDGGGDETATATAIAAFLNAHAVASLLVAASATGDGSGITQADTATLSGGEVGTGIFAIAQQAAAAEGDIIDVLLTP